ncbi:MAG TPA: YncE family protein [Gemmatimonadaceae bacterium]|nr:YncE family protein [Gemmatimonadaceae bacterium]
MNRIAFSSALALLIAASALPAQQFTATKFDIGGQGFFDYLTADPATGRVFVSRGTHIMVVDGASGKVLGDITGLKGTHGALLVPEVGHGFTTNGGDSTSTMFDLETLAVIKQIHAGKPGLDGFMYDDFTKKAMTIDHTRGGGPGTVVVIDPASGDVVTSFDTRGSAPEGGVSNGKGRIFINMEDSADVNVVDAKTWKVVDTWSVKPCEGPTGIAMDRATNRIFVGCGNTSMVLDANSGKVVAQLANGGGVDGIAFDPAEKLIYIPSGGAGNVTVVHEDTPDRYTTVATVSTMRGARTITLDTKTHTAYVFTPEFGPPPAGAAAPPAGRGRGRGPMGPQIGAWLFAIKH